MKTKIFLIFLICIQLLYSCKKNEIKQIGFNDFPQIIIQTSYHNNLGNICFTDTPIKLRPQTVYNNFHELAENNEITYLWDFGDDTKAESEIIEHTYDTPGSYIVSLTMYMNEDTLKTDTLIKLSIYPRIIEKTPGTENGKYIFQTDDDFYSILYTYNNGSSNDNWHLITYNNSDIVSNNDLGLGLYPEVKTQITNPNDNLVLLTKTWYKEYTNTGAFLNKAQVWGDYSSIENYHPGYLLVGSNENDVRIKELNADGGLVSSETFKLQIDGFYRRGVSQTFDNEIFLHYIDTNYSNSEGRHSIVRRINMDSTLVWEKEYDFSSTYSINKLSDGYLLSGDTDGFLDGETDRLFTRIDNTGNIIWQYSINLKSLYLQYIHSPDMNIFEDDNNIVIFFDNMRCIKIDKTGQLVFERYYGSDYDVFNYAIKNNNGNFVALGSRQFDNEKNEITSDYNKRDIIIIEIDKDGEPIK